MEIENEMKEHVYFTILLLLELVICSLKKSTKYPRIDNIQDLKNCGSKDEE